MLAVVKEVLMFILVGITTLVCSQFLRGLNRANFKLHFPIMIMTV